MGDNAAVWLSDSDFTVLADQIADGMWDTHLSRLSRAVTARMCDPAWHRAPTPPPVGVYHHGHHPTTVA